ncbi:MAG: hypothetical protein K0S14_2918 [Thermomicrobiales bacterium]|nr:hypothetical protein [Thermomicrobiales bacterium]
MTKQTSYLVLATPRSGSTLLGQGLQASGFAGDPKEFFGHKMPFWMERWRTARQQPELAELPLPEILYRLFPNLHFVWVTREDKVRQAISWFKARQTGVWGQDQEQSAPKLGRAWRLGDEPLQPGELAFDYDGIAALMRQAEAEDAAIGQFFATSGIEPFRVVYEEFTPHYGTAKLADDRTDEWVARFRELQTAATPS